MNDFQKDNKHEDLKFTKWGTKMTHVYTSQYDQKKHPIYVHSALGEIILYKWQIQICHTGTYSTLEWYVPLVKMLSKSFPEVWNLICLAQNNIFLPCFVRQFWNSGGFQCSTCVCISWELWYHNLVSNITSWLWVDGVWSYLDIDKWDQTKRNQTESKSIALLKTA